MIARREGESMTTAGKMPDRPEKTLEQLGDWAVGLEEKVQRYQAAQDQAEQLRLTATSGDGAISVTVGANGSVVDLDFTSKVRSFPLEEFSQQILTTMRRAQAGIGDRVAEVMNEHLGDEDDAARAVLIESLRGHFSGGPGEQPPVTPRESGGEERDNGPW
jgi:DNA-binding protein YbaB